MTRHDAPDFLHGLLTMHDAMRRDSRRLRRAVRRAPTPGLRRWWARYCEVIEHHHRLETEVAFPEITRRVPAFAAANASLDQDHDALHSAMADVTSALAPSATTRPLEAVERFDALLARHLDAEEAAMVDPIRSAFDADAWEALERRMLKGSSLREIAFTLPWVLDDLQPEAAAPIRASLPAPMRLIEAGVLRRRYRRLARAAFGPAGVTVRQATGAEVTSIVVPLLQEYTSEISTQLLDRYGVTYTADDFERHHDLFRAEVPRLLGPDGRLVVASLGDEPVGVGALVPVDPATAEVKRMYVRPEAQGQGVGRAILDRLLHHAGTHGYAHTRLQTLQYMTAARNLYRHAGFVEIPRYDDAELASTPFAPYTVFMSRPLGATTGLE